MVAVLGGNMPNAYPRIVQELLGDEPLKLTWNKTPYSFRVDRRDIRNWFGVPTVLLDFKSMASLPQESLEQSATVVSPQDLDAYWVSLQNLSISLEAERRKPDFWKDNLPMITALLAGGALVLGFLTFQATASNSVGIGHIENILGPVANATSNAQIYIKPAG